MDVADNLALMERDIGHAFKDNNKFLGVQALNSGRDVIEYNGRCYLFLPKNDRLGIGGDRVIDTVLWTEWFHTRDTQGRALDKSQFTQLQRDLVTDVRLAARGFEHGLDAHIIKNAGLGQVSIKMMATAIEAIIGAVFEDSNRDYEAVRKVMDNLGFFDHPLLSATNRDSLSIPLEGGETTLDV